MFKFLQACDFEFDATTDVNWNICRQQNISNRHTLYTWELSTDNLNYSAVEFDSIFTSAHQRQLETVYLQPNIYVRCKVWAVNQSGVVGYSRTSEAVLLSQQHHQCYQEEGRRKIEAKITSYETFSAHDEVLFKDLTLI